jgi:calcineurin-like phosphoesterase family protein
MGSADGVVDILYRLNGTITLCRGNHDTDKKISIYAEHSQKITVKDIHYEQHGGLWFICCHFPMTNPEFHSMVTRDNSEVVTLHGHVHDKAPHANLTDHSFNCSVEVIDYTPKNLHDIWQAVRDDFVRKGVWHGK